MSDAADRYLVDERHHTGPVQVLGPWAGQDGDVAGLDRILLT